MVYRLAHQQRASRRDLQLSVHNVEFFQGNRARLATELKGGLLVLTAYTEMQRRGDQAFLFEQESNFWYLSGIDAPRWKLVYDGIRHHTWLVRPVMSDVERIFNGEADSEILRMQSGADEVVDEADFEQLLRQLKRTHGAAYTVMPEPADRYSFTQNPAQRQLARILERNFPAVNDCTRELAKLRALKQPNEIQAIERAIKLTVEAFEAIQAELDSCRYEYEIEAVATSIIRRRGATHAYDPIVGAGHSACTLHYIANTERLRKKQLVLCDIGARVDGYAADITRTYAYHGASKRQQTVMTALRTAQAAIIKSIKPGVTFAEYLAGCDRIMAQAMRSLGFDGDDDGELVRRYMPHAVSHGLGIDVHDSLGGYKEFMPGMVLTVEPGVYLSDEAIGTRIEDDVLVTETGHRVLSGRLAR